MELINDNFSSCFYHPETITRFRRNLPFTIAAGFGRVRDFDLRCVHARSPDRI
jgi:hypothetical protein